MFSRQEEKRKEKLGAGSWLLLYLLQDTKWATSVNNNTSTSGDVISTYFYLCPEISRYRERFHIYLIVNSLQTQLRAVSFFVVLHMRHVTSKRVC